MKILVACEFSGRVRDAFRKRGHDAWSCDLVATEQEGPHIVGDVLSLLGNGWDMLIAFPPCTYVCSSGLHWNWRVAGRKQKTEEAIEFARRLLDSEIPKIAMENPVGCLSTRIRKPDQIIQPYNFGEDASKATCLWLKGLPHPKATHYFPPRMVGNKMRWGNQTDSGQNKLGPSEKRSDERARTYQGIANAMADQWGGLIHVAQQQIEFPQFKAGA